MSVHTISTHAIPKLYYRREGNGPVLVLLHGFPATGSLWDEIPAKLSDRFTLIIPDLPGTGNSELEGEVTTLTEVAESIKAALDDTGIDKAVIAGHSMGGYVALAFAQAYPATIAGVALVHSTAAADDPAKKDLRKKTIELIRKGGKDSFVRSFVPTLFSSEFRNANPGRIEAQIAESSTMPEATMIAFYTAMMERKDSQDFIKTADTPVQWIIGADDSIIPAEKVMQQACLSDVNFIHLYEGVGHMSMIEGPVRLASDLEKFGVYCYSRPG